MRCLAYENWGVWQTPCRVGGCADELSLRSMSIALNGYARSAPLNERLDSNALASLPLEELDPYSVRVFDESFVPADSSPDFSGSDQDFDPLLLE